MIHRNMARTATAIRSSGATSRWIAVVLGGLSLSDHNPCFRLKKYFDQPILLSI